MFPPVSFIRNRPIERKLILYSLSDNARAREALRQCLPEPLRDATFSVVLRDDAATKRCLSQLLLALSDQVVDPNSGHQQALLP